jgi:hypothetical protein
MVGTVASRISMEPSSRHVPGKLHEERTDEKNKGRDFSTKKKGRNLKDNTEKQ